MCSPCMTCLPHSDYRTHGTFCPVRQRRVLLRWKNVDSSLHGKRIHLFISSILYTILSLLRPKADGEIVNLRLKKTLFSTHSSQHLRVCVFSHNMQVITASSLSNLLLLSFRWRDGKQYFLVPNRRRVTNRIRKYFLTFFYTQKKVFRGEILFFDTPR